jgi:cytochrome c biogenesis protein CcmG/thiol:disulfide interchange protein DsbE
MRRLVFALIGLGLVAIIAIGLAQAGNKQAGSGDSTAGTPSLAQAQKRLAGSPAALAALHRQAGELLGGGSSAYRARLRALRGHPVVVNFWAAWCSPCRIEFPIFERQVPALGRRVAFMGVDVDDSRSAATGFLRQHPVTYPSYEDPDRSVFDALGAQGLPTTAYFDRSGHLQYVHQGPYGSDSALARDIRRYLGAA